VAEAEGSGTAAAPAAWSGLSIARLCHSIGLVDKEDRDFLIRLVADIDGTVKAGAGFIPIDLDGLQLDALPRATITVFDG